MIGRETGIDTNNYSQPYQMCQLGIVYSIVKILFSQTQLLDQSTVTTKVVLLHITQ